MKSLVLPLAFFGCFICRRPTLYICRHSSADFSVKRLQIIGMISFSSWLTQYVNLHGFLSCSRRVFILVESTTGYFLHQSWTPSAKSVHPPFFSSEVIFTRACSPRLIVGSLSDLCLHLREVHHSYSAISTIIRRIRLGCVLELMMVMMGAADHFALYERRLSSHRLSGLTPGRGLC